MELKRSFKVDVEGKTYVVEVEELGEAKPKPLSTPTSTVSRPSATVARPTRTEAPPPPPKDVPFSPAGPGLVKAPLTGVVLSVKRSVGESVKAGDVLLILEAMKMENEVYAPTSGIIKKIAVSEKQSVKQGDLLVEIT